MENKSNVIGGQFLTTQTDKNNVFIPEQFDEEQKMIAGSCKDFLEAEVLPILDEIDKNEPGLMRSLVQKAGELGLLGISVPAEYEGFGQSFVTSMLASEVLGAGYSFAVAYSAHTGIGSLPTLYYGTEEQKQKYIPKIATGEWAAAYCLTEPNAGSDANSGTTRAVLSECGKYYILNGQKMWITNGGFADLLTVFAKIDNDRILSAFLVERNYEGVSFNVEEKKMGIKGSSTVQIFFDNCKVPVENLLGKRGEGFRIALSILHVGRMKLGGNVTGASKLSITNSVKYANERKQFGSLIANYGAIKHKLGEQAIRVFVTESAVYRCSNDVDTLAKINLSSGMDKSKATIEAIAELAIEAAILKVFASESLDFIVDETVQIMGGMGYSAEAPGDRAYRDSRINRIFEGTNEINRLVVLDTTVKKYKKGDFDLLGLANKTEEEIKNNQYISIPSEYYAEKKAYLENYRKAIAIVLTKAQECLKREFGSEQEVMMNISDMIIQLYAAESVVLRAEKLEEMNNPKASLYKEIASAFVYDAADKIRKSAKDAINAYAIDNTELQSLLLKGVNKLTEVNPVNTKEIRRNVANLIIEENKYCI